MKKPFCSICGNENVELHESFCYDCYWKENNAATIKETDIELNICNTCGSVLLSNGWSSENTPATVPDRVMGQIRKLVVTSIDNEVETRVISEANWDLPRPSMEVEVTVTDSSIVNFPPHSETHDITIEFLWGTCDVCIKKISGGQTILQIRAIERFLTKNELSFIESVIRETTKRMSTENRLAFVGERKENHKGYDYKMGSNALAEEILDTLRKKWTAVVEKNYRLVGESKDNVRKYQHTYLFKLPAVQEDDVIEYLDRLWVVLGINKSSVAARALDTNEVLHIKDWHDLRPRDFLDTVSLLVVSQNYSDGSYELMSYTTYETIEVLAESFPETLPIGEEVTFIRHNDQLYILPPQLAEKIK